MRRTIQNQNLLTNFDQNFIIPVHDEVQFKDIAKFLDAQKQDTIRQKLESINEEVEKLGKVCDNLYKKRTEEYKNLINKEREGLDNNVKKYIYDLKNNLTGLKKKINYDYKGEFLKINEQLKDLSEKINSNTKQCIHTKNKINNLNEDCSFLEKQLEDIKDMNIYLKYKLKLFLGDIELENKKETKEEKKLTIEKNEIKDNNLINTIKHKSTDTELINNNENNNSNINNSEKENKKNIYEDKLYLTATKNFNNSFNKKKYIKNNEFDEVEYLNSKLNLEEAQLINYIQHENDKNTKLNQIYNTLYMKNKNPYFSNLKDVIDEYNLNNKSKSSELVTNNESYINNNKSIMPSIYSTSLSNSVTFGGKKQFYSPENPGHGFINRKENKEIMLNFLESIEAKKIIYKIMYGD